MVHQTSSSLNKVKDARVNSSKDRPALSRTVSLPAVNSQWIAKFGLATSADSTASILPENWSYSPDASYDNSWSNFGQAETSTDSSIEDAQTFDQLIAWTPPSKADSIYEEQMDTSSDSKDESYAQQTTSELSLDSLLGLGPELHAQVAPIAPMLPKQPSPLPKPQEKPRTCLERVLQAALDLHSFGKSCTTATTSTKSKHLPLEIDQVLLRNREVVRLLDSTLGCRCASDRDVLISCCLALTEIVSWYSAAMDTSSTCRVVSAPILMGSYSLDVSAQRSVLARVVLSELKDQIQPLLAKFPRHSIVGFSTAQVDSGLMEGQKCALREQIRAVVLKANGLIRG